MNGATYAIRVRSQSGSFQFEVTIARGDRDGLGLAFHLRSREAEKSDCCRTLSQNITHYPPGNLPSIRLTHGQAIWVLTMLGYGDGVSPKTFYEYIKSLRKLGIPFGRQTLRSQKRTLAYYGYSELMELAVTLSLRVYHVVPDSVLTAIVDNRSKLHRIYRRAYDQRFTGKGTPTVLDIQGSPIELRGCFLDLGIRFSGGRLVRFGPPKLLSPREALALSVQRMRTTQTWLPLGLSALAERVAVLALAAPIIRRGQSPKPQSRSTKTRHLV